MLGDTMAPKKERSSILCLLVGITIVSICLSLACVVKVFFIVPRHCSCVTSDESTESFVAANQGKNSVVRPDDKVEGKLENFSRAMWQAQQVSKLSLEPNTQSRRPRIQRRNVASGGSYSSNQLASLQQQFFFLETRTRHLTDQVSRMRSVTGPPGPPGRPGRNGRDGSDGRPGPEGPVGPAGKPGSNGNTGPRGETGHQGQPGVNGLPGMPGHMGTKGRKGDPGERGSRGFKGSKGFRGYRGQSGDPGDPGRMGPPGRRGTKGNPGSAQCYETKQGRRYRVSCSAMSQQPDQADDEEKKPSGQAAATRHGSSRTGGSSFTCLPNQPWYYIPPAPPVTPTGSMQTRRAQLANNWKTVYGTNYFLTCATCAVKIRSTVLMIPARKECYEGWFREYDGYLAVQINAQDHKDVICVDKHAQSILRDSEYVRAMATSCDSLPCPPYSSDQRLPCVVCSM